MSTTRVRIDPADPATFPEGRIDATKVDRTTEAEIGLQQREDDAKAMQDVARYAGRNAKADRADLSSADRRALSCLVGRIKNEEDLVTTQRTETGRDVEAALGEVLAHVRGETRLPCRIVDDPAAERIVALDTSSEGASDQTPEDRVLPPCGSGGSILADSAAGADAERNPAD